MKYSDKENIAGNEALVKLGAYYLTDKNVNQFIQPTKEN